MEVVKNNIYKQLKRNNLIVWAVVACSGLISIFAIWTVKQVSANAERYVYTISADEKATISPPEGGHWIAVIHNILWQ